MVDSEEMEDAFGEAVESELEDPLEPPEYVNTPEFQKFVADEQISVNLKYGYTQLKTFKPYYFSGQVVRGYAVFTLFNPVNAKDIYLRVKGFEVAGQHHAQALKDFKKKLLVARSHQGLPSTMNASDKKYSS